MIYESRYWKEPLLKTAAYLRKVQNAKSVSDRTLGRLEREIMLGFFSVRKLMDSKSKLTSEVMKLPVNLERLEAKRTPDLMNRHRFHDHYETKSKSLVTKDLLYVSNQVIHSFVFEFIFSDSGKVEKIAISSDNDRSKFCNVIGLAVVADLFEKVGNNYPSSMYMLRNSEGEMVVVSSA